jgi:hypothetical protein
MRLPDEPWWLTWQKLLEQEPKPAPAAEAAQALQQRAKALVRGFQQFQARVRLQRAGVTVRHAEQGRDA